MTTQPCVVLLPEFDPKLLTFTPIAKTRGYDRTKILYNGVEQWTLLIKDVVVSALLVSEKYEESACIAVHMTKELETVLTDIDSAALQFMQESNYYKNKKKEWYSDNQNHLVQQPKKEGYPPAFFTKVVFKSGKPYAPVFTKEDHKLDISEVEAQSLVSILVAPNAIYPLAKSFGVSAYLKQVRIKSVGGAFGKQCYIPNDEEEENAQSQ